MCYNYIVHFVVLMTLFPTCAIIGCTEGEVRLVGGVNYTEGRVEICLSDSWGTVCDQNWNTTEARVVCRQLGLEGLCIWSPLREDYF